MIKDFTLFLILAGAAFGLQIVVSILGGILFKPLTAQSPQLSAQLGKWMKIFSFTIFLLLGFTLVPVMVKLFTDGLVATMPTVEFAKTLQANAMYLVYGFWVVYFIGLLIAFPTILKSEFFKPEPLEPPAPPTITK